MEDVVGAYEGGEGGGDDEGRVVVGRGLGAEAEGDEGGEEGVEEGGGDDAEEEVERDGVERREILGGGCGAGGGRFARHDAS